MVDQMRFDEYPNYQRINKMFKAMVDKEPIQANRVLQWKRQ